MNLKYFLNKCEFYPDLVFKCFLRIFPKNIWMIIFLIIYLLVFYYTNKLSFGRHYLNLF